MRRSLAPRSAAAAAAAAAPAVAHARRKSILVAWYDRARGRLDAKDGAANTRRTHARAARGGKGEWRITRVLLALASLVLPCAIGLPTLAGAAFALLHWGLGGSTVTARTRLAPPASFKPSRRCGSLRLVRGTAAAGGAARPRRPPARPAARYRPSPAAQAVLIARVERHRPPAAPLAARSRARPDALLDHHTLPQRFRRHRVPRATPR